MLIDMKNILLVDDHAIVRRGLIQVLEDEELSSYRCLEAENGSDAMRVLRENSVDVVLLDIAMPGRRGTEVLGQIRQEFPKVPVLVLSSYPEDQYACRLIRAGAFGYLNKQSPPEQLLEAVESLLIGKKYISSSVANLLAESLTKPTEDDKQPLHEKLSDREYYVFTQIALGTPLTDIGKQVNLSVKTIATYRSRIMEKMRMSSNADLTLYAVRNNLIE